MQISLSDAVSLALKNNTSLRAAVLDEAIERERVLEALGQFDPVIFAELSAGRREFLFASNFPLDPSNPASPTVTRIISQTQDTGNWRAGVRGVLPTGMSYDLTFNNDYQKREQDTGLNPIWTASTTLTVTQPLLRSAWNDYMEAPAETARIQALSAHETYRAQARVMLGQVHQAYYDLVFAMADAQVQRQSVELALEQLELTRLRVNAGSLAEIEITSAQSALAGRQADLLTAESRITEAEDTLRRLMFTFGESSDWEIHLVPTEQPSEDFKTPLPVDDLVTMAESTHPDVLRAHLALASARIDLMRRENEQKPKLDLTASLAWTGLQDKLLKAHRLAYRGNDGATTWNVGLGFEYPLGNRASESRVTQQMLSVRKAALELQDTRTEMIFEIRTALRKVDVAKRSVDARRKAVNLATEQLENERLRLEIKKSTTYQVFEIESQLNARRQDLLRTLIDYRLAILELARIVGVSDGQVAR